MTTLQMIVTLAAVAGLGFVAYRMHCTPSGIPGLRTLCEGFRMPDMRFFYRGNELRDSLASLPESGLLQLRRLWLLDFLLIPCLGWVMYGVTLLQATVPIMRMIMMSALLARGAWDVLENLLLLWFTRSGSSRSLGLASACGVVTLLKWVAMGVWAIGLFANLVMRAFHVA